MKSIGWRAGGAAYTLPQLIDPRVGWSSGPRKALAKEGGGGDEALG